MQEIKNHWKFFLIYKYTPFIQNKQANKKKPHIFWLCVLCECCTPAHFSVVGAGLFIGTMQSWKLYLCCKCVQTYAEYICWLCPNVPGECSDNVCDLVSCANGGVCFANRADGYICLCPLGFRGALCEESESTIFPFSPPHTCKSVHISIRFTRRVLNSCEKRKNKIPAVSSYLLTSTYCHINFSR